MVCVKSERRFASWFATRRRSEVLDNTGAHCTNTLVLSCRQQKWLRLPQEAFGLRLQSHPQGLSFSDKAGVLHIVVFPTAPEQICFDELGNLLVRDVQGMVWSLRVQHNNLPVTFRDLLGPNEPCSSPSTLRRLSWRATSCITIDFWRCLLCLPIDFFECRPKRRRPSLLALSPRAFQRAATT